MVKKIMYRTLIRVTDMDSHYLVCVPGWNPHVEFTKPLEFLPSEVSPELYETIRLLCYVNLSAQSVEELRFKNFSIAPEPDENDGLT